jgi:hypothetical protein
MVESRLVERSLNGSSIEGPTTAATCVVKLFTIAGSAITRSKFSQMALSIADGIA